MQKFLCSRPLCNPVGYVGYHYMNIYVNDMDIGDHCWVYVGDNRDDDSDTNCPPVGLEMLNIQPMLTN